VKDLPEGWEWKRLGEVTLKFVNGGTPSTAIPEYWNGSIPWTTSKSITSCKINDGEKFISQEAVKKSAASVIPKDNVLIVSRVGIGKSAVNLIDIAISQDLTGVILDKKQIFPDFLVRYLHDPIILQELKSSSRGSTIKGLQRSDLERIEIPLPPLTIQRKIIAVLEQAEAVKRTRQGADALSEALLQNVFRGMFGDPVRNEKGWEITTFGECCKSIRYGIGMPPQYSDEGIPFVRATNVKKGTISKKNLKYVSIEDSKTIEKCRITEGNLIVVRSGVNTGDCAYVPKKFEGALAGFDLVVEFDKLEPAQFFNFLINSEYGKSKICLLKRRAAQEHLNSEQLSSLKVPNPPLALQQQFARIVQRVERIREEQVASGKEIEGLCEGLMARAFAGELVA
jgi:type I restriction enzyme S subunit